MKNCPKCNTPLVREDCCRRETSGFISLGYVLYCELCGYEVQRLRGKAAEVYNEGVSELKF